MPNHTLANYGLKPGPVWCNMFLVTQSFNGKQYRQWLVAGPITTSFPDYTDSESFCISWVREHFQAMHPEDTRTYAYEWYPLIPVRRKVIPVDEIKVISSELYYLG